MTQVDLPFARVPEKGTMTYELLAALKQGQKLTPLSALEKFHCFSLSQRMGELRRAGWPIVAVMVTVPSGKRVAQYSMGEESQAA